MTHKANAYILKGIAWEKNVLSSQKHNVGAVVLLIVITGKNMIVSALVRVLKIVP
jgi:hypothetical protein